ncbi:YheC/YheD family protein [Ferroacidibacillus organovorans]|uniref:ATP-grasp domain-containing protein n=1 Tax=Ferroacidibacillus organovorans TaxID=1765683 RepID=A0A101XRA7_9BACL|nr:YheC/YheD family protein [Ferroacidibacillus organovorans]KUO96104.1 hypothetical protein ATW55_01680 [Ferroacidibacillus organovorans]
MSRTNLLGVATTVYPQMKQVRSTFFTEMAKHAKRLDHRVVLLDPRAYGDLDRGFTGLLDDGDKTKSCFTRKNGLHLGAIYENVFVHLVMKGMARPLRRDAKHLDIPLFNPLVPGKFTMNNMAQKLPDDTIRVPKTIAVQRFEQITTFFDQHQTAYLKPIGGYGGRNVFRVAKTARGFSVQCDRYLEQGKMRRDFSTSEFNAFTKRLLARKPHLIQEEIPLVHVDQGRMDFRVVMQRDIGGVWRRVGVVPKVADRGGVVTNLVAGGHRLSLLEAKDVFEKNYGVFPAERLERAAHALSKMVESKHPTFGIAGYDLGVDADGGVWFIEMNPKPARSLLTREMRKVSAKYTAEFAVYLASRD